MARNDVQRVSGAAPRSRLGEADQRKLRMMLNTLPRAEMREGMGQAVRREVHTVETAKGNKAEYVRLVPATEGGSAMEYLTSKLPGGAQAAVRPVVSGLGDGVSTLAKAVDFPMRWMGVHTRLADFYQALDKNIADYQVRDPSLAQSVTRSLASVASLGGAGRLLSALYGAAAGTDVINEAGAYRLPDAGDRGLKTAVRDTAWWEGMSRAAGKFLPRRYNWLTQYLTRLGTNVAGAGFSANDYGSIYKDAGLADGGVDLASVKRSAEIAAVLGALPYMTGRYYGPQTPGKLIEPDKRFLGGGVLTLRNNPPAAGQTYAQKSGFASSPGEAVLIKNGRAVASQDYEMQQYKSLAFGHFPWKGENHPLSRIRDLVDAINDRAPVLERTQGRAAARKSIQDLVDKVNEAATVPWMYAAYRRDVDIANATLKNYRHVVELKDGKPVIVRYPYNSIHDYDMLGRGDAATILGSQLGTKFYLGGTTFSPNHVSAVSEERFMAPGSKYQEMYNDGFLAYQTGTAIAQTVRRLDDGRIVRPVLRWTDHHENTLGPDGEPLPPDPGLNIAYSSTVNQHDRNYYVGRANPITGAKAVEPGGVELLYKLDNGETIRNPFGAYSASTGYFTPDETHQAAKGGDSLHGNFRNFLATDKVPDSIFGYPVVQREEDYTPEDVEFFGKNPKAAGFYDLGDEEQMDESVPRQAAGAGVPIPQLSDRQTQIIAGGPRRRWALAYEDKLDVRPVAQKDGTVEWMVYPKLRNNGVIDAAGYRRFKSKKDGEWHLHTNTKPITLAQWIENADAFDAEADTTVEKILGDYGLAVDKVPQATKDTLWDMAFISGLDDKTGIRGVFQKSDSLNATFNRLVKSNQLTREEAFTLALLSELDTYHKGNHGRVMARVDRLANAVSELDATDRTPYRSAGEAFGAAVANGARGTAEEREFEGFKARMQNVKMAVEDIAAGGDGRVLWRGVK